MALSDKSSVSMETTFVRSKFTNMLLSYLNKYYTEDYNDIVILCIGTDRSTGDSLGPLIGRRLSKLLFHNNTIDVHVYGTLEKPVHAKNLEDHINIIYKTHSNPFIIAIDACLGKNERVGFINISNGPIKPGAGVNKDLRPVGDIHITGIVNIGGFMEYIVLQNTRLSLVVNMAEVISDSMFLCFKEHIATKEYQRDFENRKYI